MICTRKNINQPYIQCDNRECFWKSFKIFPDASFPAPHIAFFQACTPATFDLVYSLTLTSCVSLAQETALQKVQELRAASAWAGGRLSSFVRMSQSDLSDFEALHFSKLPLADAITVENEALGLERRGAIEALQQILDHTLQVLQQHSLLNPSVRLPDSSLEFCAPSASQIQFPLVFFIDTSRLGLQPERSATRLDIKN